MKVYIVKRPEGEYEDYQEPIEKVFADKDKAVEYVKLENSKLPLKRKEKCQNCDYMVSFSSQRNEPKPDCCDWDDMCICTNYVGDIFELEIEEWEVE